MANEDRRRWAAAVFWFWAALDLAAGASLGLWELSALWLGAEEALWFCREGGFSLGKSGRFLLERVHPAGWRFLFLAVLYLGAEAVSLLWSPAPALLMSKYLGMGAMGVGCLGIFLFCPDKDGRLLVMGALGMAGCLAALLAILPAVVPALPAPYRLRLTLRIDYNTFAQTVLLGGAAASCVLLARRRPGREWLLAGVWILCLPVVFLSASRRGVLLLGPVLAVVAWAAWREGLGGKKLALAGGTIAAGSLWGIFLLRMGLERRPAGGLELSAGQRYAAMADGSFVEKRLAIWGEVLEELSRYSPLQWLAGKGAGWNILLFYRREMPRLQQLYGSWEDGTMSAHNFLLADLLDGGLIRLLLELLLLGALALCLWGVARPSWEQAFLLCVLGVSGASCLISNRYGLWGDRFFWLACTGCLLLPLPFQSKEAQGDENPLYDDQRPPSRRRADLPPGGPAPGPGGVAGGDPEPGV